MSDQKYKYEFNWDYVVSDPDLCRPGLGSTARLEVYRLFQFSIRDILEKRYGTEAADDIFREAGALAGRAFHIHVLKDQVGDKGDLTKAIQDSFRDLGIGIVRFEKVDFQNMVVQLTVDEDLDCSGLPETNEQICVYDEGLIQGILESATGARFTVKEIDCWCSGERTCRFRATQCGRSGDGGDEAAAEPEPVDAEASAT